MHVAEALRLADIAIKDKPVPTGYWALDSHIGGLRPGSITLLAAEHGMGHQQIALWIAGNVAINQKCLALFVSTDWPPISAAKNAVNGRVVVEAASLENVPLHFCDAFGQNFDELSGRIWSFFESVSAEGEAGCLVLDSLGKFFPAQREQDRGAELRYILDDLRQLTSHFRLTTLLLADLRYSSATLPRQPTEHDLEYFDIVGKYADVFVLLGFPPGEDCHSDDRWLEVVRNRFSGRTGGSRIPGHDFLRGPEISTTALSRKERLCKERSEVRSFARKRSGKRHGQTLR